MWTSLALVAVLAAVPTSPSHVVRTGNATVQKLLAAQDTSVEKLADAVDDFVDFTELAKRALGAEWSKLSRPQQVDFSTTMKELLRASYAQKAIGQANAEIGYGKESVEGLEAKVATTLKVGKDTYPVVYKLYRRDAKSAWRIFDVVTDEVSLVETYRDMFRKLIAQKGYDGLLKTLKAKRDQLERTPGQKTSAAAPSTSKN